MSLVATVGALCRQVMAREEAEREDARRLYPKLLESDATDAQSVQKMQRVMQLLGKGAADVSADAAMLRGYRRLQEVRRSGVGLDVKTQEAWKAVEDHNAESARVVVERRQQHGALLAAHSELTYKRQTAENAVTQLRGLHDQHSDLLLLESRPHDVERNNDEV